jgi:hypothetical protein
MGMAGSTAERWLACWSSSAMQPALLMSHTRTCAGLNQVLTCQDAGGQETPCRNKAVQHSRTCWCDAEGHLAIAAAGGEVPLGGRAPGGRPHSLPVARQVVRERARPRIAQLHLHVNGIPRCGMVQHAPLDLHGAKVPALCESTLHCADPCSTLVADSPLGRRCLLLSGHARAQEATWLRSTRGGPAGRRPPAAHGCCPIPADVRSCRSTVAIPHALAEHDRIFSSATAYLDFVVEGSGDKQPCVDWVPQHHCDRKGMRAWCRAVDLHGQSGTEPTGVSSVLCNIATQSHSES